MEATPVQNRSFLDTYVISFIENLITSFKSDDYKSRKGTGLLEYQVIRYQLRSGIKKHNAMHIHYLYNTYVLLLYYICILKHLNQISFFKINFIYLEANNKHNINLLQYFLATYCY